MDGPEADVYFDHDADIGIVGRGSTLEAAFEAAARAMFGIMVDASSVRPETKVALEFEEPDSELALVTWLNRLLAASRRSAWPWPRSISGGRFPLDRRSLGRALGAAGSVARR